MKLFKMQESTQAYLKQGLMGFAGSGKTWTASLTASGLVLLMRERGMEQGNKPVAFLDTETGSDYVKPKLFTEKNIDLVVSKTRAFKDLIPAIEEAEKECSVLIIDSLTHFWREFTEAYQRKRNRSRLQFQDWAYLKSEWGKFTDAYVNSALHIILCGRAGFEYDYFEDDDGKKELQKTGIKMKAETETGYEPSLLILMERQVDTDTKKVNRVGHVLKDRFDVIDGKTFVKPTFEDFLPHIERLNLGGKQLGVDTSRTSDDMIRQDGKPEWKYREEQKEIVLDEIAEVIKKHHSGSSEAAKKSRGDLMEEVFKTRSWKVIQTLHLDTLKAGRDALWVKLEGEPYVDPKLKTDDFDLPEDYGKEKAANE